jgi:hypothetical protein
MLFKPEHIKMILEGTKTATRRNWKKRMVMVRVGGIYKVKTKMLSKEYACTIRVLKLYKQRLGDMEHEDAVKEGYKNTHDFCRMWIKINGHWDSTNIVEVIEFEKVAESEGKDGK